MRCLLPLALAAMAMPAGAAEWAAQQPAGAYVMELRVSPGQQVLETPMLFTVTTADGRPVPTAGAKGRAEFSSGGLKGTATLHPDGANRMKGYGLMSAQPDLNIEVSITFPDATALQAAFKPRQSPPAAR